MRRYDYGLKEISKHTGLSGVEAKHIAQSFKRMNIGYDVVDWEALGGDARDYGERTKTVWSKLGSMYGISKPVTHKGLSHNIKRYENIKSKPKPSLLGLQKEMCLNVHLKRSDRAIRLDDRKRAKKRFKPSNLKGVKLWMKNPNRYDVIGVDYFPKKRRRW